MTVHADAVVSPLIRFFEIGGRVLEFRFHGEESVAPAEGFLKGFYFTPLPAGPQSEPACTVEVSRGSPPALPAFIETFEVPRGLCHRDGDTLQLDIDESRVALYPPPDWRVRVWLGETAHARHPVAIINALSYAVQGALRKASLFDFHAAGLVEPRTGAGLLIPAASDSGKSSLTIRLAASGWGYLTDDMLALSDEGERVRAWAFRRTFSVREESLASVGRPKLHSALGEPVNSDPSKRAFDPAVGFPGQLVESCVPAVICFPRLTGEAGSRLERLARPEAMRRLVRHCPWASYDTATARTHLGVLGRLAAQCDTFALHAGRDLIEQPGRAAELLSNCFGD